MTIERHITIGVAGHVDHGKTSMVRCLTGIDTDRLNEEKQRGLSITSGIAPLKLPSVGQIALVDVPGHTDFLKNTIRGLSSVDMAMLVVAADDGVMPQTMEHIEILDFLELERGFVVLSKADLVDEETLELAEFEIRDMATGTFLEGKPVIPFSAMDRRGMDDVLLNVERMAENAATKDLNAPFRLWIDQTKNFAGFGTVVSGTILSGTISRDDPVHIFPSGKETRARSLEVHHRKVSQAFAGQRVGINLPKVPLKEVRQGMVLAEPGSVNPSYLLNVDLQILKSAIKPVKNRQRMKLYIGTSVTNTLVVIMEKEQLEPCENGLVQFRLMRPVAALPGDPFVVCLLNVHNVIGGGTILEIPLEKYRVSKAATTMPYLKALQDGDIKMAVERFFHKNFNRPVTADELARNIGFSAKDLETEIRAGSKTGELLYFEGRGAFTKKYYQALKKQLPEIVKKILSQNPLKMAASTEEIKNQLAPSLDEAPFQKMLAELCDEGKLIKANRGLRIPDLTVSLSDERERIISLLLDYADKSGFVPFSADTFWRLHGKKIKKNEIQRLLDYMYAQKRLIRLNNRRFLSPWALERIKEKVKQVITQKGCLTLSDSKDILGYGRTVGVPLLEYLDSIGFTRRQGDERVLLTNFKGGKR